MAPTNENRLQQRRGFFRGLAAAVGGALISTTAFKTRAESTTYVTPSVPTATTKVANGAAISRYNVAPRTVPAVRQ